MNWHETFSHWAEAPSETEESKAERAARMVREALRDADAMRGRDFDIIAIGSYRNNTNVRAGRDVDLAAVLSSAQWSEFPADGSVTRETLRLTDASYALPEFRNDIGRALRERFGGNDVGRGRISLTVDEGSARLSADVTPYLIHRRYTGRLFSDGQWENHVGVETRPAGEPTRRIIQWPEQHYVAGVAKNQATNRRYKRIVRILKCLRDQIAADGTVAAQSIAMRTKSCFIEHSVFNVPNGDFDQSEGTYYNDARAAVAYLWRAARDPAQTAALVEVSMMQPLFRADEQWTAKLLEDFMFVAWQHVGFAA